MKNLPLSYIEISKSNLVHNVLQFKRLLKPKTKIAAVIKANAYGHGQNEVIQILNSHVDYFQVNSIEELELARTKTKKEILVLGYVSSSDIERAIKLGCILGCFDLEHLLAINLAAKKLGIVQKVHIACDAHLGREGFMPADMVKVIGEFKNMKNVSIEGVYAHFANIEDTDDMTHALKQKEEFRSVVEMFKENGYKNIHTHISATSGILAHETDTGANSIVRLGLGMYGMWPSESLKTAWKKKVKILPALRWVTHIAQVKVLPKGHSIGYGLSYITKKETKIALIPQGYSNGLPRVFSNKGQVLIGGGKRVPILGRVAMNMFVVDVSALESVLTFDEVVILGAQGKEGISAEELALQSGTINYEVTTRISPLLPRVII